jgi:hypothetical protein
VRHDGPATRLWSEQAAKRAPGTNFQPDLGKAADQPQLFVQNAHVPWQVAARLKDSRRLSGEGAVPFAVLEVAQHPNGSRHRLDRWVPSPSNRAGAAGYLTISSPLRPCGRAKKPKVGLNVPCKVATKARRVEEYEPFKVATSVFNARSLGRCPLVVENRLNLGYFGSPASTARS